MRLLISNILRRALCALTILGLTAPREASAQQAINFIRDAEIETTIRQFVSPVFTAAGLDAAAIRIYLVNDARLNAFVAGGQNLFLHTGLLIRSQNPNQVIGVAAHETGHIAGGHLARTQEALHNATIQSIIAMGLGAAAAAAAGGQGAGGILSGAAGGKPRRTRPDSAFSTLPVNHRRGCSSSSAFSRTKICSPKRDAIPTCGRIP